MKVFLWRENMTFIKIKSFKKLKKQKLYNLGMKSGNHNYILSNGLISKNSHSISYSFISYQCAWLLTHYEKEWIQACLECDEDRDKIMADVSSLGYKFNKPDINTSSDTWKIDGKNIYVPLTNIKGIGKTATKELIEKRRINGGSFKDIYDLFYDEEGSWRWRKFSKKAFDALMLVEGFDSLNCVGHKKLFNNYKQMYKIVSTNFNDIKKEKNKRVSLEELSQNQTEDNWTNAEKIEQNKDLLGTYDKSLLFSPQVFDTLNEYDILPLTDVCEKMKLIWFIVKDVKQKITRTNKPYVALKVSDVNDGNSRLLNYFGKVSGKINKNEIYVSYLFINKEGYLNIPYGKELIKISDIK